MTRTPSASGKTVVTISVMTRKHLAAIVAIEEQSFPFPWSPKDFIHALKDKNCVKFVAADQNEIVGYMVFHLFPKGLAIMNLAVHPLFRRQRVAARLIEEAKEAAIGRGCIPVGAMTSEANLTAHLFLRDMGFRCFEIVSDQYREQGLDGYAFEWRMPPLTD